MFFLGGEGGAREIVLKKVGGTGGVRRALELAEARVTILHAFCRARGDGGGGSIFYRLFRQPQIFGLCVWGFGFVVLCFVSLGFGGRGVSSSR